MKDVLEKAKELPEKTKTGRQFKNLIAPFLFPDPKDVTGKALKFRDEAFTKTVYQPLTTFMTTMKNDAKDIKVRNIQESKGGGIGHRYRSAAEVVAHLRKLAQSLLDL